MVQIKKKVILAGGLSLGAALISQANADEVKPENKPVEKNRTTGHLDVSVDHTRLDNAISRAQSIGINIVRGETQVLIGDANQTAANIAKAKQYYATKVGEIEAKVAEYKAQKEAYEQALGGKTKGLEEANGVMSSLRANLSANGQTVRHETREYNENDFQSTKAKLEEAIAKGKAVKDLRTEVDDFARSQASYADFQAQNLARTIKLKYETVRVSKVGDTKQYLDKVKESNQKLADYIKGLGDNTKAIPESQRPTFTLYNVLLDEKTVAEAEVASVVPTYVAPEVDDALKPTVPTVDYFFYDIRSQPVSDNQPVNKDNDVITTKETRSDGTRVYQAIKGQTVGITGMNEPLPDGRFDKIHNIINELVIPEGLELDMTRNVSDDYWKFSYDKETRTARWEATSKYLIQVNNKQNKREGTLAGTISGEWFYTTPGVFLKVAEDNKEYRFSSTTLLNDEYMTKSKDIAIQTNEAAPEKHNKDDKGVQIDGKTVWFGTTNNYHIKWDFDQYRGVKLDRDMKEQGTSIIDYAPFDLLEMAGNPSIKYKGSTIATGRNDGTFVDTEGKVIEGLTWKQVDSVEDIDRKGPAIVAELKGANNPLFNYVEKGENLEFVLPMRTKVHDNTPNEIGGTYGGNTFANIAYQKDFGNIYISNEVVNHTPVIDPRKDAVLSISNLTSLDLKNNPMATIEKGSTFQYRAKSSIIDVNTVHDFTLNSYKIRDTFHEADQYDGKYFVETGAPIAFKEGTVLYNRYKASGGVMPANSDITKYTTQSILRNVSVEDNTAPGVTKNADTKITLVDVNFDEDFMSQIDFTKNKWTVDMFFETKRVQNVNEVTNTVEEVINGKPFTSNETRTNTRVNAVEKLREDVDNLTEDYNRNKETQDKFNETVSENLTVIRKQIADNKAKQDKKDVEQDAQIRENTLIVRTIDRRFKEVHTRIDKAEEVLADHTSQLSVIRKQIDKHEERLNEIDKKLDEGFSTLTIYVPEVTTDTQAFEYAINRGIAPRSIKSIDLNEQNQYVVTYNTSETGITGSRQAFLREKNIEAFREGHKPKEEPNIGEITFYNKNSEDEVRSELRRYGYDGERIVDISLRGKEYVAKVYLGKAGERVTIPTVGETTKVDEPSKVDKPSNAGEKVDVPAKEADGAGTRVTLPASENGEAGSKVELPNSNSAEEVNKLDLPSV